ncbi:MAG: hypothetical protein SF053_04650 [Bacteroidia bacterium]|nr:hypothetical protein [Bacteroidia bacterium]
MSASLSPQDHEDIRKYYGKRLEDLTPETFRVIHRQLQQRYHPDNFEKYDDEAVREMALDRFKRIEALAAGIQAWFATGGQASPAPTPRETPMDHPDAVFSAHKLRMEIRTSDKDLKYRLFRSYFRWLDKGESYKIPGLKTASLILDEAYAGSSVGFQESVKLYVTFGPEDPIEQVAAWLYAQLQGQATAILIGENRFSVNPAELLLALRRITYRGLRSPDAPAATA